jgi:hypothetical protein
VAAPALGLFGNVRLVFPNRSVEAGGHI